MTVTENRDGGDGVGMSLLFYEHMRPTSLLVTWAGEYALISHG
jgi:hypothetical protein